MRASAWLVAGLVLVVGASAALAEPLRVAEAQFSLRDEQRGKDLDVVVVYPRESRSAEGVALPLIVFSHGAGGSADAYRAMLRHWAGHGFICIAPEHADARTLRQRGDARTVVRDALTNKQGWIDRPKDVTFVLDQLDTIEAEVPQVRGRIDRARIGVGGHSYGAYTAMAIGGVQPMIERRDGSVDLSDPRVTAILAMSGQGPGQMGLTESSWTHVDRPTLSLTGTRDGGAMGQDYTWRRRAFELSPAGEQYFAVITGANHFSFAGQPPPAASQRPTSDLIFSITTAWWDAQLKGDETAKRWLRDLATSGAQREPAVELEFK